jgi:hypothetical protein
MADNIDEPTPAEEQEFATPPQSVAHEYFNIREACDLIARHYGHGFKHLSFIPPMQIVDGCVVEFVDDNMKVVVASARMRFRNRVHIDKDSGQMRLEIVMSDLTFIRSRLELSVSNPVTL